MEDHAFLFYKKWIEKDYENLKETPSAANLVQFQTRHKYLFMALQPAIQKQIGRMIAGWNSDSLNQMDERITNMLAEKPSRGSVANSLMHMFGYFRNELAERQKREFLDSVEKYRSGLLEIELILKQLKEWAESYDEDYLNRQSIFSILDT
ncbi:DUF1722 domain-containing protein [Gracilibacillus oryzae]|nr:YbgA family protein [Gracilibacillus oryzae]